MQVQCLKCKGRGYCGRVSCPIIAKSNAKFIVRDKLSSIRSSSFSSASPAPFIGRVGYPFINVGVLSPVVKDENVWEYDDPRLWAKQDYPIPKIIDFRSSLVNSRAKAGVLETNKFVEIAQEIGMACKPVDVELSLKAKPQFNLNVDSYSAPMGPHAELEKARLEENPKVKPKVEKAVSDTDLKANDAVKALFKSGIDENFLSKLLSVGMIGVKKRRKLVPTRWSITAVDDNLGKDLIRQIKDYNEADYLAFYRWHLGNYYLVLMFPEKWSYELFEAYLPNASWNTSKTMEFMTDYESYSGRTSYAENCAGGYYAARLPILEKLVSMKRQASVLVIRLITGEYTTPLGVWVCREAARKAVETKPLRFSERELMLRYAKILVMKKFGYDIADILDSSILLNNIKSQSKLSSFF